MNIFIAHCAVLGYIRPKSALVVRCGLLAKWLRVWVRVRVVVRAGARECTSCTFFSSGLINIGYTMNPRGLRDLDARGNLYKHPRAKRKGVYGFQGDLNPIGPEGSSYKVFIL